MTVSQVPKVKEFTGRHMLMVMCAFFGVIITANMTLAWFAAGSWSGLVAKNGYVESINYKDKQAALEKQRQLGWKSKIQVVAGHLTFSIKGKDGKPISNLTISAKVGRPATEVSDREVKFREAKPGEYLARAPQQSGQWLIMLLATSTKNQSYQKKYRVIVEASK